MHPLLATLAVNLGTAVVLMLLRTDEPRTVRTVAMLGALLSLVCIGLGIGQLDTMATPSVLARVPWIPSMGVEWHFAADGISAVLMLLTAVASVAGVLFSWNVESRNREFFALYFLLLAGCYGVFLSFDLFVLFLFYELAIIPKYFLIAIWGSSRGPVPRETAAMKLVLYSFVGSALILVGILAAHVAAGGNTFSLRELAAAPFSPELQRWAFPAVFFGFAVLGGLWPFHSWAPTGHSAAPTAASMLLAGVVMKLGAYGCLRVAMVLFPAGYETWRWFIALLAVVGIVYGAAVALTQRDFKYVIGFSSVSHMGFVMLGLATATLVGLQGAVLQMFSHGIIAGLLFAVVGRMVYDRLHTRDLGELERRRLSKEMPFATVTFSLAAMASMGFPGFSGFVAEFKVLVGTWMAWPWMAVLVVLGILVGVAYHLRVLQRAFFGEKGSEPVAVTGTTVSPATVSPEEEAERVSIPERLGAVLLLAFTLAVGCFPGLLLDWIAAALQQAEFARLLSR